MKLTELNIRPVLLTDVNHKVIFVCKDGLPSVNNLGEMKFGFQVNTINGYEKLPIPIAVVDTEEIDFSENNLIVFDLFGNCEYVLKDLGVNIEDVKTVNSKEFKELLEEISKFMMGDKEYARTCLDYYINSMIKAKVRTEDGDTKEIIYNPEQLRERLLKAYQVVLDLISNFNNSLDVVYVSNIKEIKEDIEKMTNKEVVNLFTDKQKTDKYFLISEDGKLDYKLCELNEDSSIHFKLSDKYFYIPFVIGDYETVVKYKSKEYLELGELYLQLLDTEAYNLEDKEYIRRFFTTIGVEYSKSLLLNLVLGVLELDEIDLNKSYRIIQLGALLKTLAILNLDFSNAINQELLNNLYTEIENKDSEEVKRILIKITDELEKKETNKMGLF